MPIRIGSGVLSEKLKACDTGAAKRYMNSGNVFGQQGEEKVKELFENAESGRLRSFASFARVSMLRNICVGVPQLIREAVRSTYTIACSLVNFLCNGHRCC